MSAREGCRCVVNARGQALVVTALAILALVGMFLLVLNGGLLYLSRAAFDAALANAATAALRTNQAGLAQVDPAQAVAAARHVLTVELHNVTSLQEPPGYVADTSYVEVFTPPDALSCVTVDGACYSGPVVRVTATGTLCPPAAPCRPVTVSQLAAVKSHKVIPGQVS